MTQHIVVQKKKMSGPSKYQDRASSATADFSEIHKVAIEDKLYFIKLAEDITDVVGIRLTNNVINARVKVLMNKYPKESILVHYIYPLMAEAEKLNLNDAVRTNLLMTGNVLFQKSYPMDDEEFGKTITEELQNAVGNKNSDTEKFLIELLFVDGEFRRGNMKGFNATEQGCLNFQILGNYETLIEEITARAVKYNFPTTFYNAVLTRFNNVLVNYYQNAMLMDDRPVKRAIIDALLKVRTTLGPVVVEGKDKFSPAVLDSFFKFFSEYLPPEEVNPVFAMMITKKWGPSKAVGVLKKLQGANLLADVSTISKDTLEKAGIKAGDRTKILELLKKMGASNQASGGGGGRRAGYVDHA